MSLQRRLTRLRLPSPSPPSNPQPGLPITDERAAVLARRLRGLGELVPPPPAPVDPRVSELKSMIDALVSRQQASLRAPSPPVPAAPALHMPGERRQTDDGEVRVIDQFLEPDHHHGRTAVSGALAAMPQTVAKLALDSMLATVDPSRALYLDTETTGLSAGAGTIPFLTGLAWFEDGALVLEQLILDTPADEPAMLHWLSRRILASSCLITYNGKSFDWPLLMTRYVMNRIPAPPLDAHLDLLHCARRVYKRRLGVVRLVNVESEVLGFRRIDDIDGKEIPERYWAYIRGADASQLAPVIEHNANDLVALAALLGTMARRYEDTEADADPRDHVGLAQLAVRAAEPDRAASFAHLATEGSDDRAAIEGAIIAARLHQRGRRYDAARALLESVLPRACASTAPAVHLMLAKLYEHRVGDFDSADRHARLAADAERPEDFERRVERIKRRAARPPKVKRVEKRRSGSGQQALAIPGRSRPIAPADPPAARCDGPSLRS